MKAKTPRLTKLELRILDTLWSQGPCSIPELLRALAAGAARPPAYTTVQTLVYRLEWKQAIRRTKAKITNAHVFEAAVSKDAVRRRMIDELLDFFGGNAMPVVAHLIDTGKLTERELREARKVLRVRGGEKAE